MDYSFDVRHAQQYGVDEAIMIKNFQFWIMKNKANGKNQHDGKTWTYNSVEAYRKLFPFWKSTQIRRILESLIRQEVLVTGNYNTVKYDRTLWYAFKSESTFIEFDLSESENGSNENSEPIPDNKPDEIPSPPLQVAPLPVTDRKKEKTHSAEYKALWTKLDSAFKQGYNSWSNGKPFPCGAAQNKQLSTICTRYAQCPDTAMELVRIFYRTLMRKEKFWDGCAFTPMSFVKNESRIVAMTSGLSNEELMRLNNGDMDVIGKTKLGGQQ